jgi:hypothetical protein
VHLVLAREKGIGSFAALFFILCPPTVIAEFICCAVRAVCEPRQRAGNHHRVERVMPKIPAILFGELLLFLVREFIPTFARWKRM